MTAKEWFDALQCIDWVLIVAILLLFAGYIYLLLKITQLQYVGGFIGKRKIRAFGILFGFLVVSYLFCNLHKIQPNEWVEISLLVGLVAATCALALYAAGQADTSVKMAKEMREQRYSESLPLIIPTIPPILRAEKLPLEAMKSGNTVKVVWCNVGKGVAINTRFSFWTVPTSPKRAWFFPPGESITLEVNGKKEVDYSEILNDGQIKKISEAYSPRLEAEYQDIHERKITTVQEFRIDAENERVSLGDLYFTINGRRLGREITEHD